uniref:Predicted protein n=1 Tax=Hordeum vulgare subsp. vulgare TaxID=112509 RepID=F2DGE5_HORVV|nr:predicted protein [Hordeum vulgare subsp. vulgare]
MASTAVADANAGGFGVEAAGVGQVLDGSNPAIVRLRQLVDGPQSSEGWRRCWEQGVTPWDVGGEDGRAAAAGRRAHHPHVPGNHPLILSLRAYKYIYIHTYPQL